MIVAVTGATGNVGTAVLRALSADERVDEIVAIARRPAPTVTEPPGIRFYAADMTHDDLAPALRGVDVLIHLAWMIQPSHHPTRTWAANVVGSEHVFTTALDAGVRAIVHASSVGTYSAAPTDDRPVDETWPTHSMPTAAYGREKAYVERILDHIECDRPDVRVVRLRQAFVFQEAAASEQRRLFLGPLFPNAAARLRPVPVLPHPDGMRFQAVHADDVAEAHRLAVFSSAAGAFNIAADDVVTPECLGQLTGARRLLPVPRSVIRSLIAAGWHTRLIPADPALFDLFMQLPVMSTTRARVELGWAPRHSGRDAVAEVVAGLASGAGGATRPLRSDSLGRRVREWPTGSSP